MPTALWIVIFAALALLVYVIWIYNRLVRNRNMVREGWSGIDVQLRRRADLVPNLVESVKAYAAHEQRTLEEVTSLRRQALDAKSVTDHAVAERALSGALGRLLAVAEAYPDLKADANFRELQAELSEIEDHLQMARRYYNGTAREMNILAESFPSNLVARQFGFGIEPYFELEDRADAEPPRVQF